MHGSLCFVLFCFSFALFCLKSFTLRDAALNIYAYIGVNCGKSCCFCLWLDSGKSFERDILLKVTAHMLKDAWLG